MFITIVGAGAEAGSASRYGSGSDQIMRLRLRNTAQNKPVACNSRHHIEEFTTLFTPSVGVKKASFLWTAVSMTSLTITNTFWIIEHLREFAFLFLKKTFARD
jgi:hypothetical protein